MKKVELKHLAPYLPYGLKYHLPLDSERFESIMENEPFYLALPFMDETEKTKHFVEYEKMYLCQKNPQIMWDDNKLFLGQMISSLGFEEDDVYLDEVKPILRPLSDLTKEIELNGEKFVPIQETDIDIPFTSDLLFLVTYGDVQKLLEWHFDVFGLIENNLAIDINKSKNK